MSASRTPRTAFAAAILAALLATPAAALESERLYLSGRGPGDAVPWDFEVSAGRRAGEASTLPVPSHWELHGFGTYRYGMDDPGSDESGRYRVRFAPPASWAGRRVELVFEGVMTDCSAVLNGEPLLPVHRGGFTRFRYEVTARLRLGEENQLEVAVDERSADESVERAERTADYWIFGGIYRPVYLEASPVPAIDRVRIDAAHDGRLAIEVTVAGAAAAGTVLEGELRERWSGALAHRFSVPVEDGGARVSARVEGARAWSAEEPWLYELRLALAGGGGPGHQRSEVVGFRTFGVAAGRGLLVNGKRVLLKGVNRPSFWPTTGRALDAATNRRDAELLVALNANAVRASHYPPDSEFLRACDELGLYVIDELPGWHDAYDSTVGRELVRELVERDHNHPSVVAWANGNEGGWNRALDAEFARLDLQARPVLHPGDVFGGIDCGHYPSWEELRARLDPRTPLNRLRRAWGPLPIVLPTEALHGLYDGGLGAGLEDYWDLVRASPAGGGLFLWSFVDEGLWRGDRGGALDTFGNYGADGILGPFREQEGSFWAVRATWSPIAVLEREIEPAASPAGVELTVENRYDLSGLDGARLAWEWLNLPEAGGRAETVLARGTTPAPAIGPGERAVVKLRGVERAAAGGPPADALRVRALDRSGREVSAFVLAARQPPRGAADEPPPAADSPGTAAAGGAESWVLAAGDVRVELDPRRGQLVALRRGANRFVFASGPRGVGERAPPPISSRRYREGGDEGVAFRFEGALEEARFTLERSGWLRLDYVLRVAEPAALAGVVFDLDEREVRAMRWVGDGPYRVWGNRRQGGALGLWSGERNDTATGVEWRYPELPGYYSGVRWATLETAAGELTVALDDGGDRLLGVLRPRFAEGTSADGRDLARDTRVAVPDGALSILHAIPGIGTKFHRAEALGPQGRRRLPPGRYAGRVRLRLEASEALGSGP